MSEKKVVRRRKVRRKKKQKTIDKKIWIIIGGIIAGLVIVYLAISVFFMSHFYINTQINGKNFSGKNAAAVENYIKNQVADYKLTIVEQNNMTDAIEGSDISLVYKENSDIEDALKKQNAFLWPQAFFSKSSAEVTIEVGYDEAALESKIESVQALNQELEKLQTLKDRMEETALLEETAEEEAEKVLKDLNLENMQLLSSDKILWYAQSDYPEATILEQQEALWNADPNLGKTGYRLTYVPSVSGLKINQDKTGGYSDDSGFAYAPSMPVEQIYIVVTEDGIRSFKWKGMSQEEKIVTENVKLLAFDEIENRLIDQVKYLYPSSQPAESKTIFGYDVATVELGYTYIPAYKNPQNAWLVPAWFFTISESQDATAELGTAGRKIEGYQTDYIVLNATDGGRIGSYWR